MSEPKLNKYIIKRVICIDQEIEIEAENDVQALSKSFDGNFVEDIDWHESDSGISEYLERTVQRIIYEKV